MFDSAPLWRDYYNPESPKTNTFPSGLTRRGTLLAKAQTQLRPDLLQVRVVLFIRRELIPLRPENPVFLASRYAVETFSRGFSAWRSARCARLFMRQGVDENGMHLARDRTRKR
ncbi:hypothetical protein BURKHO8Y_210165 [Burkholderia sp. 8Y]|nr:hypothetical protein BURKHO8Y_210165 [Burkholderia sp. 8Y]